MKKKKDSIAKTKKIDSREAYFRSLNKQVIALEALDSKIKKAWVSFEKSSNATQRKRAHTKFKNLETELAPIFKKCCLKLKVFEEYLQRVNPELKSIARDLHNLELSKKDLELEERFNWKDETGLNK